MNMKATALHAAVPGLALHLSRTNPNRIRYVGLLKKKVFIEQIMRLDDMMSRKVAERKYNDYRNAVIKDFSAHVAKCLLSGELKLDGASIDPAGNARRLDIVRYVSI